MDVVSEYVIAVSIFALGCLAVMVTQPSWWLGLVIVLALLAGALIAFGLVLGSTPQWMRQAADVGETIAGIILVPAAVLALRLW
jgi:secretion protein snm4